MYVNNNNNNNNNNNGKDGLSTLTDQTYSRLHNNYTLGQAVAWRKYVNVAVKCTYNTKFRCVRVTTVGVEEQQRVLCVFFGYASMPATRKHRTLYKILSRRIFLKLFFGKVGLVLVFLGTKHVVITQLKKLGCICFCSKTQRDIFCKNQS